MSQSTTYAPITKADLAAARMWGIKLPSGAPMAVEAPAPAPDDPEDDGPAWTWPAWTDSDVWTITETEPAPLQADDESMTGPADAWVNVTPFVAVRTTTTPARTDSRPDAPRGRIEAEGPRESWDFGFAPTKYEADQASRLFAPPRRLPARLPACDPVSDRDVHPRGVC